MVTKSFTCPNGHRWSDGDESKQCPVCGAVAAETIASGISQDGSTGAGSNPAASELSGQSKHSRFGRYIIVDELGHGGMGIVYRAFDPVHERHVALKTVPNTDPTLLSRFKREFRVLAGVDHPNIVKLFELTSDGQTWFFTMEIVEGVDLLRHVGYGVGQPEAAIPDRPVAESDLALTQMLTPLELSEERQQRLRDAFVQLAEAIGAMHASSIVHRDIKPSNVIVTPAGRVVLLDFGLVAQTDPSGIYQSLHQSIMGTAAYMSPEQAACDAVSTASDWYSVGVMLYQSLTGRLPFSGKVVDVLVNKQNQDPLPPRDIEPSLPESWNDLCMDLLSRNPKRRPQAEDILQRLGKQSEQTGSTKTIQPDEVPLVGRESQLQLLQNAWQAVLGGRAKCVFVEGASGTGKSALAESFVERAKREGAVVLNGRCYEMESVPFKAIDSLIDSLVTHLTHSSQADAAALMPRDVHALARLFSVIGQVEAVANLPRRQIDISDQQELNRRAIGALRELLGRMGDRFPLVVYIDDLQWGDEDSAAMLSDLLQLPDSPLLMFLGTYRSEDSDTSPFLQAFRRIQRQRELPLESSHVKVGPLEDSDASRLALALLGREDPDAEHRAESIAQEAAGNPFFITELVKHFQLDGGRESSSTEPLFDMIWSRVRRLSDESQRLLAVVALWGQPMPLEQAMHIAGVGQRAVGPLRAGHLIRMVGLASSSRIETYHDRVREAVSQRLDQATRQQHHLHIAEDCVQRLPFSADEIMGRLEKYFADRSAQVDDQLEVASTWYDIAFHFDAAERSDLAFPYALATAEKARTQFSLEVAEQQYRIAQRDVGFRADVVRYRVAESLGRVLMLRGRYAEAENQFTAALELTSDPLAKSQTEAELAELAFKRGDLNEAMDAIERGLHGLGATIPRWSAGFLLRLLGQGVTQLLHSLLPAMFLARRKLQGAESQLLIVRLFNRLAYAYWFKRGRIPCLWAHLRGMNLAELYPPTAELGQAYSIHAPVMSLIAFFSRGVAYAEKSFATYKSLDDLWGQGQSLHFHGIVLYVAARYDECLERLREATRLLERTGDLWEANMSRTHIANALHRTGDLAAAAQLAERVHFAGIELGDIQAMAITLDTWAKASGGCVDPAILQTELERPRDDVQVRTQVMLAEGLRLFYLNRFAEAQVVFEQGQELAEESGVANPWTYPHRVWLVATLRRQWEMTSHWSPEERIAVLKRAGKLARKAVRVARKFQNDLPHALREAGLICAMQGSQRRARKYLDESLEVARRQGAKFEHAQTLLARGRTGRNFQWPEADEEVTAARRALMEMGADFALSGYELPEEVY